MTQDIAVVIPSVRDPAVVARYCNNARKWNFDLDRLFFVIVTEDHVEKRGYRAALTAEGVDGLVFGLTERNAWFRERKLGRYANLIPRRSHAETSFGLLIIYERPELRYGFFIDDDTAPVSNSNYFATHISNLEFEGVIPELWSRKAWVNPLFKAYSKHHLYPRGYPYSQTNENTRLRPTRIKAGTVAMSQGLWTNIPDLDAVRILTQGGLDGKPITRLWEGSYGRTCAIARGAYVTVCSMNLAFRREIIPAFYQLPMDDNPWKVGRFDDIWAGIIAKRAMDALGWRLLTGRPLCRHDKFPRNVFKDLRAELPALELNETFHEWVTQTSVDRSSCASIARSLSSELSSKEAHGEFPALVGRTLRHWLSLLRHLD